MHLSLAQMDEQLAKQLATIVASFHQLEQESTQLLSDIIADIDDKDSESSKDICVNLVPGPRRDHSIYDMKEVNTLRPKVACDLYSFVRLHHWSHRFESNTAHKVKDFDKLYDICKVELRKPKTLVWKRPTLSVLLYSHKSVQYLTKLCFLSFYTS